MSFLKYVSTNILKAALKSIGKETNTDNRQKIENEVQSAILNNELEISPNIKNDVMKVDKNNNKHLINYIYIDEDVINKLSYYSLTGIFKIPIKKNDENTIHKYSQINYNKLNENNFTSQNNYNKHFRKTPNVSRNLYNYTNNTNNNNNYYTNNNENYYTNNNDNYYTNNNNVNKIENFNRQFQYITNKSKEIIANIQETNNINIKK